MIAIDDVKFINCEYPVATGQICLPDQYGCKSGHCVAKSSTCDLNNDCCDRSDEDDQLCDSYFRFPILIFV